MRALSVGSLQQARRWLYSHLGRDTYGALSHTVCKMETIRGEGWSKYRALYAPPRFEGQVRTIQIKTCATPIYYRPGTSDVIAIVQNLIRHSYGNFSMPFNPRTIVDGGGYIGDVSLYYLNRYPQCRVVTMEPNPASYALAQKNLKPYGARVNLHPMGLWSHPTQLGLHDDFFIARLTPGEGDAQIECIDLVSLMRQHEIEIWDLVKLDVEHAEAEIILNDSDEWLARTRVLVVEFHTPEIREKCTARLSEKGYAGFESHELAYFFNRRLME